MEEPSLGPAERLAVRLLRHWLEAGELGMLKRVGVHRGRVGCLREDRAVQRSGVQSERVGVQSEKNGLQSVMEEWGAAN